MLHFRMESNVWLFDTHPHTTMFTTFWTAHLLNSTHEFTTWTWTAFSVPIFAGSVTGDWLRAVYGLCFCHAKSKVRFASTMHQKPQLFSHFSSGVRQNKVHVRCMAPIQSSRSLQISLHVVCTYDFQTNSFWLSTKLDSKSLVSLFCFATSQWIAAFVFRNLSKL